jgi:two-component system, OmpR family, sensor kinase
MGRIFWKIFFACWFTLVVTALGVGITVYFYNESRWANNHKISKIPRIHRVTSVDGKEYLLYLPRPRAPKKKIPPAWIKFWPLQLSFGLGASLLLSALLAWNFTRPVRHLQHATKRLAKGDLNTRVMPLLGERRDEFAELGHDFDHMAEKFQSLLNAETRLLHDISHELRSPLSRLQLATELLRQQPQNEAMLQQIEREVNRLNALISEVLTLSRYEADVSLEPETYLELTEFVEEIVKDQAIEMQESGHKIEIKTNLTGIVKANPELLRRAVENVLRNALKYSPNNSVVTIELASALGDWISLKICDKGPGIEENFLSSIFQPFFRLKNTTQQGYGLGLTIAKRSIEAIGGKINAMNLTTGGLCIEFQLPLMR